MLLTYGILLFMTRIGVITLRVRDVRTPYRSTRPPVRERCIDVVPVSRTAVTREPASQPPSWLFLVAHWMFFRSADNGSSGASQITANARGSLEVVFRSTAVHMSTCASLQTARWKISPRKVSTIESLTGAWAWPTFPNGCFVFFCLFGRSIRPFFFAGQVDHPQLVSDVLDIVASSITAAPIALPEDAAAAAVAAAAAANATATAVAAAPPSDEQARAPPRDC